MKKTRSSILVAEVPGYAVKSLAHWGNKTRTLYATATTKPPRLRLTIGDGLSLLVSQLPGSGIPVGGCRLRSHVFALPPPGLPVALWLTRQ